MTLMEILFLLLALQFKHLLGDFIFQTKSMVTNKGSYGHVGGLIHSGLHAFLSFIVFSVAFGVSLKILLLCILEFVIHYHLDWGKNKITSKANWTPEDNQFWWAIGIDQFLHHLTYIALILAALKWVE